ncbi:LuxR C-terminal-related transcriptional regulator [Streptacidiphilus rugosus]|uniref:LuxR C-terminal-related transcriptional regulator n=1 Tax=Streptacidiphilus rugosus TaxID=405783 RepID=UPI000562FFDD|nr:LuxR C-terminal-related transcriptional regulator [Streptacidiphilus rugosus]
MIGALGLDVFADAVYRALLAQPGAGIQAVAASSGLSVEQVRAGLDSLSELALVHPDPEDASTLRAMPPDLAMDVLFAHQQAQLAAQQEKLTRARAQAAQLVSQYTALSPTTATAGVEHLQGLDRIRVRLAGLSAEARREVMIFAPDGPQTEENLRASQPLDQEMLDRGIRLRSICLDSVANHQPTIEHADWLASQGGEIRVVATLPTRMVIFDRATAVIPVTSDDTAAAAVVLTSQGPLTMLVALFESTWAAARPLGTPAPQNEHGLTPQEHAVLTLLAQGHTYESSARRLGVSTRTARRIATDLLERLGARSLFEAGAKAAWRGWIVPDAS